MTIENTPKFTREEIEKYKNWLLPDVSNDKAFPSAKNERIELANKNKKKIEDNKPIDGAKGESVEIIEELVPTITAEQLKEINDSAHREGFEIGYLKGLEQGINEGKDQGYKTGHEEGINDGKQLISHQCEQLQHVIDALLIPLESEQNQLQTIMLEMVSQLSRAVILRELSLDSSHITQLVDSALETIPVGADKYSLYLNPQDLDIVEDHLEHFKERNDAQLLIHRDENLLPGGCRLETQQTIVDYSVEQRLETIINGFIHKRFVDNSKHDKTNINLEDNKNELKREDSYEKHSHTKPVEDDSENKSNVSSVKDSVKTQHSNQTVTDASASTTRNDAEIDNTDENKPDLNKSPEVENVKEDRVEEGEEDIKSERESDELNENEPLVESNHISRPSNVHTQNASDKDKVDEERDSQ